MRLVQERDPVFFSQARRPDGASLRYELLSARSELLFQVPHGVSPQHTCKQAEEILEPARPSQQSGLGEVIAQQASAKLQHIERALDDGRDASYGICRECRNEIPFSRLRFQPQALFCLSCIEGRLEHLSADAL